MRERIPELAARDRIDAGGRLIQQQHAWLRDQRASQRQLLFHPTAQSTSQPALESIHIEHPQITPAALCDLIRRNLAQVADVANVFHYTKIRVEAEGLCQITGLRPRLASRLPEYFRDSGCGFHYSSDDLKCRGLARAIGADQSEDFSFAHLQIDIHARRRQPRSSY